MTHVESTRSQVLILRSLLIANSIIELAPATVLMSMLEASSFTDEQLSVQTKLTVGEPAAESIFKVTLSDTAVYGNPIVVEHLNGRLLVEDLYVHAEFFNYLLLFS